MELGLHRTSARAPDFLYRVAMLNHLYLLSVRIAVKSIEQVQQEHFIGTLILFHLFHRGPMRDLTLHIEAR
ncbi:MAG TPA: hypothetical protein VLQ46_09765 [Casimicrobiaceae bacterium]|nr:hypothetical protein [Casimicrobiaceae bacterium]